MHHLVNAIPPVVDSTQKWTNLSLPLECSFHHITGQHARSVCPRHGVTLIFSVGDLLRQPSASHRKGVRHSDRWSDIHMFLLYLFSVLSQWSIVRKKKRKTNLELLTHHKGETILFKTYPLFCSQVK